MSATGETRRRRYRGRTPEERDAERRARLRASGLELFGTDGWNATSIEELCRHAQVTTRHFYELYGGREAAFLDLYDHLVDDLLGRVAGAVADAPPRLEDQLRAGLEATVGTYSSDERIARVLLVEVHGISRQVEEHRRRAIDRFAEMTAAALQALAPEQLDHQDAHTVGVALVGAVTELFVHRMTAGDGPSDARIVDQLVRMFQGSLSTGRPG